MYTCAVCKKRTRDTGTGEANAGICAQCYHGAGLENEHSDTGTHENSFVDPECPTCQANDFEFVIVEEQKDYGLVADETTCPAAVKRLKLNQRTQRAVNRAAAKRESK